MKNVNTKLLAEFLSKAVKVRRLIEQSSSFEDKAATLLQIQALKFIKAHPKTPVGSLASELAMSFSAVTQLTNRLADGGFVKRANDPTDRRIISLLLTTKGEEQIKIFSEQMMKMHYIIFASIPDNDLKEMIRIFGNILDSQGETK